MARHIGQLQLLPLLLLALYTQWCNQDCKLSLQTWWYVNARHTHNTYPAACNACRKCKCIWLELASFVAQNIYKCLNRLVSERLWQVYVNCFLHAHRQLLSAFGNGYSGIHVHNYEVNNVVEALRQLWTKMFLYVRSRRRLLWLKHPTISC